MPQKGFFNLKFYILDLLNEFPELEARIDRTDVYFTKHESIFKIYYLI